MPQGQIEHANLTVSDPARSAALFRKLCGWDERWRGVFVVVVSGRDEDRAPALSFGADAFLPKPYPIPRLIELMT